MNEPNTPPVKNHGCLLESERLALGAGRLV
jgi:hypothetical protein